MTFRRSCSSRPRSRCRPPSDCCFWLRRALSRAAATDAGSRSQAGASATLVAVPASSFAVLDLRAEPCSREILEAGRDAWLRPWQTALVYAAAGATFAAITAIVWRSSNRAAHATLLFWTFYWPAVISVNLVAGTTPATRRGAVAAYFSVFAAIAAFGLARDPNLAWRDLAIFWWLVDALPTALLAVFLARPLRAVGPLVFAVLLMATALTQLAIGDAPFGARLRRARSSRAPSAGRCCARPARSTRAGAAAISRCSSRRSGCPSAWCTRSRRATATARAGRAASSRSPAI